jgi:hypothetical protein
VGDEVEKSRREGRGWVKVDCERGEGERERAGARKAEVTEEARETDHACVRRRGREGGRREREAGREKSR